MLKRLFKAPNAFVLIFSISLIVGGMTWIIPGGEYDREEIDGREVVVSESYHEVESRPQGLGAVLKAPFRGFVEAAGIIAFVLITGGAFRIVRDTGAVDRGIVALAKAHDRSRWVQMLWIPLFMTVFSLGGAVIGMSEEIIPFVLLFVPLALTLGYDSVVGVAVPYVGAHAGFAAAFLNPFTVGIAQGIAEVPLFSGMVYRLLCWAIITLLAIAYVVLYAKRIHRRPELSPTFEMDQKRRGALASQKSGDQRFRKRDGSILGLGLLAAIILGWGVLRLGWYLPEIAALFVAVGIIVGWVGGRGGGEIAEGFVEGARELIPTALIIALARGILVVARDGRIIDTILQALANPVGSLPTVVSAQVMFVIQSILNFFVPSGSGQAALTMPIMAPLGDLVGVSRQTAVLAFQFGDGFSNMIIPTSAVLMGVLGIAEISWDRWARWMLPLQVLFFLVGLVLLAPPVLTGWS